VPTKREETARKEGEEDCGLDGSSKNSGMEIHSMSGPAPERLKRRNQCFRLRCKSDKKAWAKKETGRNAKRKIEKFSRNGEVECSGNAGGRNRNPSAPLVAQQTIPKQAEVSSRYFIEGRRVCLSKGEGGSRLSQINRRTFLLESDGLVLLKIGIKNQNE